MLNLDTERNFQKKDFDVFKVGWRKYIIVSRQTPKEGDDVMKNLKEYFPKIKFLMIGLK